MTEDLPVEIQLALAYEKARDPDGREALGAVLYAIASSGRSRLAKDAQAEIARRTLAGLRQAVTQGQEG